MTPAERVPDERRSDGWRQNLKTVFLALALAFGVRIGIAQAYEIDGPSMEPTMFQDERVLVARCAYGLSLPFLEEALLSWATPAPGDVVIVQSPRDGLDLVKRVIGLPGDRIEVREGVIFRNGEAIAQREVSECDPGRQLEPDPSCRVYQESLTLAGGEERRWRVSRSALDLDTVPEVAVPDGHLFLVGDHRDRSNDSRSFGPVPASRLRGRVLMVD